MEPCSELRQLAAIREAGDDRREAIVEDPLLAGELVEVFRAEPSLEERLVERVVAAG
jgi:hypothetical protein